MLRLKCQLQSMLYFLYISNVLSIQGILTIFIRCIHISILQKNKKLKMHPLGISTAEL